ncbi:MAG: tRNA lysidine(34) synthetase TilS, partial [Bryobacteraceae bacterium]
AEKKAAPVVLSVDHGLRADSHKDAEHAKKLARDTGLKAHVLSWKGAKPSSDVEAEARAARYRLMGEWCVENKIPALYVAHTVEDQAETFLLRLGRGSGLDGLSAMRAVAPLPVAEFAQVSLVRPLLEFRRDELRAFLKARRLDWRDDPMNTDPRFARARLRAAWPALEDIGLTPARVADAADHLGRARAALDELTGSFLRRGARFGPEDAALDPLRLKMQPREIGLRALADVLSRVSGEPYRPRFDSLERLFDAIVGGALGGGATLHGCKVAPALAGDQVFGSATLTISREKPREVREPAALSQRKR